MTLLHQNVANALMADAEVILPTGIAGVGLGQTFDDDNAVAVRLQCLRQIALRLGIALQVIVA